MGRLFLSTGLRMVYPFLPAFSRGLGVSLAATSSLVSLRNFAGLLSPIFSPLSERFGRRPILALSMLLFSAGCVIVFIWPTFWAFGLTLAIIAIAKVIYDPAMQAYLGDTVVYEQRGKALAITELSWAGAFFISVPAVGFVIQRQGWPAPFLWLSLLGILAALVLRVALPALDHRSGKVTDLRSTARVIGREPVIWAAGAYILLVMAANELILIVYGDWMEVDFGLNLTSLGLATGVIGTAEVSGEILTGLAVDWLGKRPVIITTGLLTAFMYLAIPVLSVSLVAALAMLFALFLFFEMTVVGGVPLMTEIVPSARGVVMSVVLAAGGLGRALGALIGPALWLRGDFRLLGLTAATTMLVAVFILARWIREAQVPTGADLDRP
jgi:predicted MFS family arabinose efflux permease